MVSSAADRMISKLDILNPESGNAVVRLVFPLKYKYERNRTQRAKRTRSRKIVYDSIAPIPQVLVEFDAIPTKRHTYPITYKCAISKS